MNKTTFYYALAGGLFGTIFFLGPIVFSSGSYMDPDFYDTGEVIGYSVMILSMLPVYFGTRAYRNHNTPESFSFAKGLRTAILITLVACVIFYLGNVVVYELLAPDFLAEFGESYKENMIKMAETEAERQKFIEQYEMEAGMLSNSYLYALVMAGSVFFIGLIVSLISALVLRTKSI